ncbi:CAP domain-containing protein [Paenibacillus chitinolyticus]|uniref:CAP domain-containing protein n=1 Tax=Paenibacillus chitinolyticus TaxID=79263 RepID=UPI0036720B8B
MRTRTGKMLIGGFLTAALLASGLGGNGYKAAAASQTSPSYKSTFKDTKGHWAEETIRWAYEHKMTDGYADGTFRPDKAVTEPEFLALLLRAYNKVGSETAAGSQWFDPYYTKAAIYSWPLLKNTTSPYLRGDAARLIAATQGNLLSTKEAVQRLLDQGLSQGKTDGSENGFRPDDALTRAEALKFLQNLLGVQSDLIAVAYSEVPNNSGSAGGTAPGGTVAVVDKPDSNGSVKTESLEARHFVIEGAAVGDTEADLIKRLGQPDRKDTGGSGLTWYIYNTMDYKHYLQAGIKNGRVAALYTVTGNWTEANGVTTLMNEAAVRTKMTGAKAVGGTAKNAVSFETDGLNVSFYFDTNDNGKLIGMLVQDTSMSAANSSSGTLASRSEDQRTAYEKQTFDLTNAIRVRHGKAPFAWDASIASTARKHSEDMAVNGYFDHTNKQGLSPFDRMEKDGLKFWSAAENIASGYSGPIEVVNGWMNSSGHRKNIMGDTTRLGVGVYFGGSMNVYYTQNFYTPR